MAVADLGEARRHCGEGKVAWLTAVHLIPAEWRRHPRVGLGPHRVGRGHGPVLGILVVVHEYAMALLLPPLARRNARRAPLDLARERQRRPAHLVEGPAPLDAHIDVHPARARGLGPAGEPVVLQRRLDYVSDLAH